MKWGRQEARIKKKKIFFSAFSVGKGNSPWENSRTRMGIQRALKAIGGTSWAGETLSAEAAGNSEVTLVHFWTVSQAWEILPPTPTLWRLVGSGTNRGGGDQAWKGDLETKYSTGSHRTVGASYPQSCWVPPGTSFSNLTSTPIQHIAWGSWIEE